MGMQRPPGPTFQKQKVVSRTLPIFYSLIKPLKDMMDVNGDGKIDYKDVIAAAKAFGKKAIPSKSMFDANNDGDIDHKDALLWVGNII